MKLRGAFDPRIQIATGLLMVVIVTTLVVSINMIKPGDPLAGQAHLDLRLVPIYLLLGLAVGLGIGKLRLRALRKVLPEVEGQLYFSEASVLRKTQEGANALSLQRLGYIVAFLVWFGLGTYTSGKILGFGSMSAYILGQYLTGVTLPFARLFLELRKNHQLL